MRAKLPKGWRISKDPLWSSRWAVYNTAGDCVAHAVAGVIGSEEIPTHVMRCLLETVEFDEAPESEEPIEREMGIPTSEPSGPPAGFPDVEVTSEGIRIRLPERPVWLEEHGRFLQELWPEGLAPSFWAIWDGERGWRVDPPGALPLSRYEIIYLEGRRQESLSRGLLAARCLRNGERDGDEVDDPDEGAQ